MRALVLGGTGMLGHKVWQVFRDRFETHVALRRVDTQLAGQLFEPARTITGLDVTDFDALVRVFASVRPNVVVNAVGIVKQLPAAKDPLISLSINSMLPHRLANLCSAAGARLIHVSTDCIFSGAKGRYREDDQPDAEDLYGRSKLLGEVHSLDHLTVRTSIIGRELGPGHGLVEWFLAQQSRSVQGHRQAVFSGLTTQAFADVLAEVIEKHPRLSGVYHVSAEPINKFTLLGLMSEAFGRHVAIDPVDDPRVDRSLDSTRFRNMTGWTPLSWSEMIQHMAADTTQYDKWRMSNAS